MGSCSGQAFIQSMGERTIGATVKETCVLLGIPEEGFSSHSWRRSSATSLADAGASFGDLKRAGRWRSASVVEGYIEDGAVRTLTAAVTSTPRVSVTADDPSSCPCTSIASNSALWSAACPICWSELNSSGCSRRSNSVVEWRVWRWSELSSSSRPCTQCSSSLAVSWVYF